jgi:putative drug exporter of the RND superfamily
LLGVIWILASVTALSSLSVSVVTLLGLGLAIDYSLLMVTRYREERVRSNSLRI